MNLPFAKKSSERPRRRQVNDAHRTSQQSSQSSNNMFKRNRTLTGSISSTVSSAAENSSDVDLRSPRAHAHHLAAHRRRLSTILIGVVIVCGVLLWLLYEFIGNVRVSSTDSSAAINDTRYQEVISSYLDAHPMERLRFLTNESQLTQYMITQVPEVAAVQSAGSAGLATGQFDIAFRQPVASWQIGSKQYYVDSQGVSYQTNYFGQPSVKIIDQSGVPQTAGNAVASSRFLQFVGRTVDSARQGGLVVEQAIIPSSTTRQVEVKVVGHGYPIKLSLDRPVGEQTEDMERAIRYFDSKGVKPEYIDVRVSGKAFYK